MKKHRRDIMVPLGRAVATGERWNGVYFSIIAAIVIAFTAAGALLAFIIWLMARLHSSATDPAQFEANQLALTQVITGLVSFGAAIGGLVFVVLEVARNRAAPSLEVSIAAPYSERERVTITLDHDGAIDLVIRNHGNLAAEWFMLEFDVPFLAAMLWEQVKAGQPPLAPITAPSQRGSWHTVWYEDSKTARLRFESDGELAVYPGAATRIGRLHVPVDGTGMRREHTCHYRIYSDCRKPESGQVRIKVEPKVEGVKVVRGPSERIG